MPHALQQSAVIQQKTITPIREWFNNLVNNDHKLRCIRLDAIKEEQKGLLSKIEEMTKAIPLDYNAFFIDNKRLMHLKTEYGEAYTTGVYSDQFMSIAKTVFQAHTGLEIHYHPEKERIAVLEGELEITLYENEKKSIVTLRQFGSIEIAPNVHHSCRTEIKTAIIADLMPYSPFFPKPHD